MAKKTAEEVAKEIETLKKMKTSIRQFSHFGDNNWEKVEVQITALQDGLDEDGVYDAFEGNTDHEGCALAAIQWRDGEEETSPSEDWKPLLVKTKGAE